MGRFVTGVSVMTTTVEGDLHGMTASSVSSLSLDPYLVLVCVERVAVMHDLVQRAGVFALSWLSAEQEHLSRHFAARDRPVGSRQFDDVSYRPASTGSPIVGGSIGFVDCRIWATYDGGDHSIVCGEVVDLEITTDAEPLLYFASEYHRLPLGGAEG